MPRWSGPALVAVGALIAITGVVGTLSGGGDAEAAPTTTVAPAETASSETSTSTSTTTAPATTSSTTSSTTTTTAPTTTTSSTEPTETVEAFVDAFSAALASGDTEFVSSRLHPVVLENWGEDLCRAWIEREVMALSEYTLISVVDGPLARQVSTPNGEVTVADYYRADVSFVFSGETFFPTSGFALVGNDMHWLGQCR